MAVNRTSYSFVADVPSTIGQTGHFTDPWYVASEPDGYGSYVYLAPLVEHTLRKNHMPSVLVSNYSISSNQQRRLNILQAIKREMGNRHPKGASNPDFWRQLNDGS